MKLSEFFKTHEWVRGRHAVDKNGLKIEPLSQDAVGFCLIGGWMRMNNSYSFSVDQYLIFAEKICNVARKKYGYANPANNVYLVNDLCLGSQEQVIELLEEADM